MERDQAVRLTQNLLKKMVENRGSDLFITADFPPAIKIDGTIRPFADRPLTPAQSSLIVRSIMNDKQAKEFDATKECNFAIAPQGIGRFRVSAFVQQGSVGAVIRTIVTKIPSFEDLDLPHIPVLARMEQWGLALDTEALRRIVRGRITAQPLAAIDYVSLADAATLRELDGPVTAPALLSLAVAFGAWQLIDPLTLRDRAMLELFYSSGLRLAELVGLNLGDVDMADRTVRVVGKGAKARVVPVWSSVALAAPIPADPATPTEPAIEGRLALPRPPNRKGY